jgi:hypothetical protein
VATVASAPDTLFDVTTRFDSAPKYDTQSLFNFLNRRAGRSWDRVRAEAEKWYAAFPDADRRNLRNRFRQDGMDCSEAFRVTTWG